MLKQYINRSIFFLGTLALFNCGGGSDDDSVNMLPPEVANLASPLKDEECKQGNIVSDTESDVKFEWSNADNATSYSVILKNLNTNTTQEITTNDTFTTVKILRGIPYSWHVISKNNTTTTATSETWKFYNAGEGVINYAPFPAEVISPNNGGTTATTVTLEWAGSDIDNDISSYDVYLDTTNPPTLVKEEGLTTNKISNINLNANTDYFWMVITKDDVENTSKSQVFNFKTQ